MSLRTHNYDVTESGCPDCGEGTLWVNSFELVCDSCNRAFRTGEEDEVDIITVTENYYQNRKHHRYGSGKVKMPGGFANAYPYSDTELLSDDPTEISEPYQ